MSQTHPYKPQHPVRIVTAASLFDGHDAAINIMRRIIQSTGVEVIHLGHDRSVEEVVNTAIQEDVQAIALTSYQGGHNEYFTYMYDLLQKRGSGHIKIFGGGGGVILPEEIDQLMAYGIARIYSPEDGRKMGLQGMINDLVAQSDVALPALTDLPDWPSGLKTKNSSVIGRLISTAENDPDTFERLFATVDKPKNNIPVLGITGTGGAGKSSLIDELIRRFTSDFPDKTLGIISVDPSKRKTGGALLGDRIRMNAVNHPNVYMRSLATRQSNLALSKYVSQAVEVLKAAAFDFIILETSGIGQSDTEITEHSDFSLYVMTPEFGAASQLEKIDMLDFADLVAINKFDKRGAADALRDVKKQFQRNHGLWDTPFDALPVFGTIASQFNDGGMNTLYVAIMQKLADMGNKSFALKSKRVADSEKIYIIPPHRTRYLSEISEVQKNINKEIEEQATVAQQLYALHLSIEHLSEKKVAFNEQGISNDDLKGEAAVLQSHFQKLLNRLKPENKAFLLGWHQTVTHYAGPEFRFKVRGKEITVPTHTLSLSGKQIPKISLPRYSAWGDLLRWALKENLPGAYPFTAGIYPFKRQNEDPTRMFAGEGSPERTNKRFHYVSFDMPAKRLSTAFDSVTLYGRNPDTRPDIYGKIGNAGVSVCCLDDAKKLYSGFDLTHSMTSVSMTINGPAPMLLAFFMNAAIDQQCEKYIKENGLEKEVKSQIEKLYKSKGLPVPTYKAYPDGNQLPEGHDGLGLMLLGITGDKVLPADIYNRIKAETLSVVRGTVQADILKEDQAQNTCIFSTEFALRLMGDVQAYFIDNKIRNFYSVSISGYHIAEAGANPITQLAFTLSNGFTYVEYYLSRGMHIDDFAPNLSFFFSNGVDPEYAVIGRVARRIWARAMKEKYGGNTRSQMLKYHIQTSGRSLHAQEIDFNDIRTTLQALYAIYDNCNSLHTNAYDEAITTPTEASVRRAMAIQLIINKELGLAKNENPLQGSFIIEELTDLVEEAVMLEFDRITERGGVLGAMETMYQRTKIQEESLHYETLKHTGEYPIVGVNTFLNKNETPLELQGEVMRATETEKHNQIATLENLHKAFEQEAKQALESVKTAALNNENMFEALMEAVKYCSLGQITETLFEVGGQYRRNM